MLAERGDLTRAASELWTSKLKQMSSFSDKLDATMRPFKHPRSNMERNKDSEAGLKIVDVASEMLYTKRDVTTNGTGQTDGGFAALHRVGGRHAG